MDVRERVEDSVPPEDVESNGARHKSPVLVETDAAAVDRLEDAFPTRGVPVMVLTGMLGAGKTTLLNHILQSPEHGLRAAVLVNELGEIDIDSQLLDVEQPEVDAEGATAIRLSNGCICCTINNSLVEAVKRVLNIGERPPDYVVIETTGVADPAPIVSTLQESELDDHVYVDHVLCVVDAYHLLEPEYDTVAARSQMQHADTILLSKVDLLEGAEAVQRVVERVLAGKPNARILQASRGRGIPLRLLLDVPGRRRVSESAPHAHVDGEACACSTEPTSPSEHLTLDGFVSVAFECREQPLVLSRFRRDFVSRLPPEVYRAKGLLWFDGYPLRFVFQLCGRRFQVEQDEWPAGQLRKSQVVVIGRRLDREQIVRMLQSCIRGDERR